MVSLKMRQNFQLKQVFVSIVYIFLRGILRNVYYEVSRSNAAAVTAALDRGDNAEWLGWPDTGSGQALDGMGLID